MVGARASGSRQAKGRSVKLIAFDLETTGIRPESDRIMEFCSMPKGLPARPLVRPGIAPFETPRTAWPAFGRPAGHGVPA